MLKAYVHMITTAQAAKERGAAMPEYGLLVALIALVAAIGATALGGALQTLFTNIGNQLTGAN